MASLQATTSTIRCRQCTTWPLSPSSPASTGPLLHYLGEVTVTEDKINAFIKAAGVNVEPFWPGLFAYLPPPPPPQVNIRSLICNIGAGEPAPAAGSASAGGPALSTAATPAEKRKVEAKKEESEESDDDMGFGLFD
uniref:Large ribosomal subunit protein P2 n=1 Tax=Mus spicilegus TaxID=10103 RepID=A0A8C6GC82_MUSSI